MSPAATRDKTLASALLRLRRERGSHDKIAGEIGTNRQTYIAWEKGRRMPAPRYRAKLIALGVSAELFAAAATRAQVEDRLRVLEGEIAAIRGLLQDWP